MMMNFAMMNVTRQTRTELYERGKAEIDEFVQNMRRDIENPDVEMCDEVIIGRALMLTVMNEMLFSFDDGAESYCMDEIKMLLTLDNPLQYLYTSWLGNDDYFGRGTVNVVRDAVLELAREIVDTATKIACWSNGVSLGDMTAVEESLYRADSGEYFLRGCGGGATKYGRFDECGEEVIPLTVEEAKAWAMEHIDGEKYEAIFGAGDKAV
jgi:hypothetical protein